MNTITRAARVPVYGLALVLVPQTAGAADRTSAAQVIQVSLAEELASRAQYPRGPFDTEMEGITDVSFWVGANGRPTHVRVIKTSRWRSLDAAAVRIVGALRRLPSTPARITAVIQFGGGIGERPAASLGKALASEVTRIDDQRPRADLR